MLEPVRPGILNLLFGLVAIAFGASGQFALMGTDSSKLLVGAGVVVALFGVIQLWRSRR